MDIEADFDSHKPGELGKYVVDSTKSYGLFLVLHGKPVFVDLREDKLLKKREKYATFLFDKTNILENKLSEFLEVNPEYKVRHLKYIGLHSKEKDEGEVFWEPEGYTKLRGLEFSLN